MKRRARPLSALVLTIAACGGSSEGTTGTTPECCHNPPPQFTTYPAPPMSPGDRIQRSARGECVFVTSAGESRALVACPPELPRAGTLFRDLGGSCQVVESVECPPPSEATCNPPPPQPVACPEGSPPGPTRNPPAPH